MKFIFAFTLILFLGLTGCSSTQLISSDTLKHTRWQLVSVDGVAFETIEPITIDFIEALQVSGYAGCNRYFGQARAEGELLKFNNLGMTRKLCDDTSNQAEQQFLALLQKGVKATFPNSNELTLSGKKTWLFRLLNE